MSENTVHLRQELIELAAETDDDVLLVQACLVLRGEGGTIIFEDTEKFCLEDQ